ncbi:hypothetical protein ACFXKK_04955 [Streptomyces globisporus]
MAHGPFGPGATADGGRERTALVLLALVAFSAAPLPESFCNRTLVQLA